MPLPRVKLACVLFSSALVLSPVALAGCDRLAATDPAQAARVAASASAELGVLAEKGADSVVVAPTAAETPKAGPGEQTVIPPAASADVTPEAAALSPADFTNSILFDATRAPNDKVFEVDALGSWKLLGVLDANGTVTTAAERGPMALTFRGKGGTVETEREKLPLTWSLATTWPTSCRWTSTTTADSWSGRAPWGACSCSPRWGRATREAFARRAQGARTLQVWCPMGRRLHGACLRVYTISRESIPWIGPT